MFADSGSAFGTSISLAFSASVGVETRVSSGCDCSTTSLDAGVTPTTFFGSGARASGTSPGCSKPRAEDGLHTEIAL
jgi:hypothetical protein